MCGIAGFVDFNHMTDGEGVLNKMVESLAHRGPDGNGIHFQQDDKYQLGLGHTRLSILDLSDDAAQPMFYEHLVMVFNGEIYNFEEVRDTLSELGHQFVTTGDSEVILHAFREWGAKCVNRFIGMFAIVIYDSKNHELTFIRDRVGVKPIFYYYARGLFIFGSEMKALRCHPRFPKEISTKAVSEYLDFGFINAPNCIFKDCEKLEAGMILKLDLNTRETQKTKYWDPAEAILKPKFKGTYEEAKEEMTAVLKSAFKYRMVSDVPVGVFLSAGVDSTSVAGLLTEQGFKLKTFTVAFPDGKNEAPHAKRIAEFLGSDHHEYDCTYDQVKDIIYKMPYYFDEPMADSTSIPTTLICKMARQKVTVALSADGGDEIFAGYRRFGAFLNYLKQLERVPYGLRKTVSKLAWPLRHVTPDMGKKYNHRVGEFSQILRNGELDRVAAYSRYFQSPEDVRRKVFLDKSIKPHSRFADLNNPELDPIDQALLWDFNYYLQDNNLTKLDRASMTVSLEGREPLLDHRIWELAATLPNSFKMGGQSKRILRDIMNDVIPKHMTDLPKSGFSMPIYKWMRGDMRPLLEECLGKEAILASGLFDYDEIEKIKNKFLKEKFGSVQMIWKLVNFQHWFLTWK